MPDPHTPIEVPVNIQEFNKIAGFVFAQLYASFPVVTDIDRAAIATAFGLEGSDWSKHKLSSGRTFGEVLAHTIAWLSVEDYIRAAGSHPAERVTLTTKGLAAMSAVPAGLKQSLGIELARAAGQSGSSANLSGIGDLIGGFFGGFTKSLSNG